MENTICKICSRKFESNEMGKSKLALSNHLIQTHQITPENYYVKYELNGVTPSCYCGCGLKTNFYRWKFRKYYGDHKNKFKFIEPKSIEKIKEKLKEKNTLEYRLNKLGYSVEDIKKMYTEFINLKYSFIDLTKIYFLDKRTIKKYWKELGLIDDMFTFERVIKYHKYLNGKNKESLKEKIDDDLLFEIFTFIKENDNKLTLNEIRTKYNLKHSYLVLYRRLNENFGEDFVKNHIKFINSSKSEIEFFHILKFYFGKNVTKQHKIENKKFDFLLGNKLLIEYDGDYWHSLEKNKIRDIEKNDIALRNGYELLRIKDSESKNIEILIKIKELYEKIK